MDWSLEDLYAAVSDQLGGIYTAFRDETRVSGLSVLLAPVEPYNRSALLAPLVSVAGAVGLLVLSGLSVGSFAVAIAALLAVYYVLTEVFGYELTLAPLQTGTA